MTVATSSQLFRGKTTCNKGCTETKDSEDVEFWGRKIRKYSFGDYNNEQMMQIR